MKFQWAGEFFAARCASKESISLSIIFAAHLHCTGGNRRVLQFNSNSLVLVPTPSLSLSLSLSLLSYVLRAYLYAAPRTTIDERHTFHQHIQRSISRVREARRTEVMVQAWRPKKTEHPACSITDSIDKHVTCRDDGAPEPRPTRKNNSPGKSSSEIGRCLLSSTTDRSFLSERSPAVSPLFATSFEFRCPS